MKFIHKYKHFLSFLFSFMLVGFYFSYLFQPMVFFNPHKYLLGFFAFLYVLFVSFSLFQIFNDFLDRRNTRSFLYMLASFVGSAVLILFIEFHTFFGPIYYLYVNFGSYLKETLQINIFYLDYGGFGEIFAVFLMSVCALLSQLLYNLFQPKTNGQERKSKKNHFRT